MAIRISALNVPRFRHGGIEVGPSWLSVSDPEPSQRAAIRDFHGRFIRVHPEDRSKLGELELRFVGEREPLADLRPAPAAPKAAISPPPTAPKTTPHRSTAPAAPKTKNEER